MPGDVPNHLPFGQRGDTEAVVPVPSTEEQLPVGGHCQRAGAEVRAGGKRALQEALGPGGEGHGTVAEPRVGLVVAPLGVIPKDSAAQLTLRWRQ